MRDAREVEFTLRNLGFNVEVLLNPTSRRLNNALNKTAFSIGKERNRALLFYFAGHGETLELADGTELGYIIPSDCPLKNQDPIGFDSNAISMKEIEALALKTKSKHFLMLFDSCFSGSLFNLVRAAPTDISEKSARYVRQFITAGSAGEQVPDWSIFKIVFLDGIKGDADLNSDGYVTCSELGMHLQDKVVNYTCGGQHPQYGKINNPDLDKGDFVFVLGSGQPAFESEKQRLAEERAKLERERRELEEMKALADERKQLEAERKRVEAEKQRLAMAKRPPRQQEKKFFTNAIGMKFVYIPPGTFMMGSPLNEKKRDRDETQHEVTLTKDFYMQTTEVTQGQWREIMGSNPSYFKSCGDDCPVEQVSWNDCQEFIKKLNQKEGTNKYRLPTETEWEYACRSGGRDEIYAGGNDVDSVAWYSRNSGGSTHEAGTKAPNGLGIYDMSGNVWEWCEDIYNENAYSKHRRNKPIYTGGGSLRVYRGGSWGNGPRSVRCACRDGYHPDLGYGSLGFRLARPVK